jgi:uncharacterized protein (TIGR02217 family)
MPIPSFIERPRFELPRGWICDPQPEYDVSVTRRGNKGERRNLNDPYPLTRISVTIPRERVSDIPLIRRWYHVCRGRAVGFRVQDPSDYLSTPQGFAVDASDLQPTPLDQPLVEAPDGSGARFQLYRQYLLGEDSYIATQERPILKPVLDTIRVANASGVEQPPSRWTLDDTTGILTIGAGFDGVPATWGGEFDLPMRFDSELPLHVEDFRLDETSFELLELGHEDL